MNFLCRKAQTEATLYLESGEMDILHKHMDRQRGLAGSNLVQSDNQDFQQFVSGIMETSKICLKADPTYGFITSAIEHATDQSPGPRTDLQHLNKTEIGHATDQSATDQSPGPQTHP